MISKDEAPKMQAITSHLEEKNNFVVLFKVGDDIRQDQLTLQGLSFSL
jgi:hypothetical protein